MTDTSHPIGVPEHSDAGEGLRIECYIRPDVSRASLRQIKAIQERLQALSETSLVAQIEVKRWPPKHDAEIETVEAASERDRQVSEFERWAQQHDCTLEPAFQRRHLSSSVLGPDEPREEICVPTVTLALYEEDEATPHGVVPYTTEQGTEIERIYTVDDWLTAAEQTATTATTGSDPNQDLAGADTGSQ
ncbi:MAG: hypothetical protein ACI8XM_002612 [Haloarculaceae archaeon]|jgi:hypothetical protein